MNFQQPKKRILITCISVQWAGSANSLHNVVGCACDEREMIYHTHAEHCLGFTLESSLSMRAFSRRRRRRRRFMCARVCGATRTNSTTHSRLSLSHSLGAVFRSLAHSLLISLDAEPADSSLDGSFASPTPSYRYCKEDWSDRSPIRRRWPKG